MGRIEEIARQLDMAPTMVKKALEDHPDVNRSTKRAINEIMEELNSQQNEDGDIVDNKGHKTIGIIIPEIKQLFFSTVIEGIEDVAYANGFSVLIGQSNEKYLREVDVAKNMLAHNIDGLLVSLSQETCDYNHFQTFMDLNIPVIFFDRICEDLNTHRVVIDDFRSAFNAVEHLIATGKRKIAHLCGDQNLLICKQRFEGYKAALTKYGIPYDEDLVAPVSDIDFEKVKNITKAFLDKGNDPNGLFAVNDLVAYGAMLEIKERGMRIPEDIAIMGFCDWHFSALIQPGISSINQSGFEMGQEAMRMFLEQLASNDSDFNPRTKIITSKLMIRGSTIK